MHLSPFTEGGASSSVSSSTAPVPVEALPVEEAGETVAAKCKRRPAAPSAAEIAEHECTHYPYRDWCRYCVAAEGRRDAHSSVSSAEKDDGITTLALDYCYFNDRPAQHKDEKVPPAAAADAPVTHDAILVVKDARSKAIWANIVQRKGADEFAVKMVVSAVLWAGYDRVKLRSDGEAAIRALIDEVAARLKRQGVQVVLDRTPVGDSQAAGLQESAVLQLKNKARKLWHQFCELQGIKAGGGKHLLPWCIQYAAQLITRTHKGSDGKTPWGLITGRGIYNRPLIPWGERVLAIAGGGKFKAGVSPKWVDAVFLAVLDDSSEYICGTPEGCFKSSNIKRVSQDDARDLTFMSRVRGLPWKMTFGTGSIAAGDRSSMPDLPVRVDVASSAVVDSDLPSALGRGAIPVSRKFYIRRNVELEMYGTTDQCPGCTASLLGSRPVSHNGACRMRIAEALKKDGHDVDVGSANPESQIAGDTVSGEVRGSAGYSAIPAAHAGDSVVPMDQGTVEAAGDLAPQLPGPAGDPVVLGPGQAAGDPVPSPDVSMADSSMNTAPVEGERTSKARRLDSMAHSLNDFAEFFGLEAETEETLNDLHAFGVEKGSSPDLVEMFGPGRFDEAAAHCGLTPGIAFDLKTGWDFNIPRHVEAFWRYLERVKPYVVVGSPDCKAFSTIMNLNKGTPK